MLDMKMTLLCAELPLILLLVVLLAVWAVQLVLNRRAKEQTNEQPAADAAAQQQEAVQPEPVYESQPQEQPVEQYAEQPEVVEEAAYAEEETYAEQEPYAEEPVEQAEEAAYAEEPAEQAEEVVYAEEVTEEETYAEETVEEVPEQSEEYAEQNGEQPEQQNAAEQPEGQAAGASYNLTGNSVVFERGDHVKQTWAEKYEALDEEKRGMLDKVFDHVTGEEGVRRLDLTANVRVKYKTHELFKADIKRGVPVLNFMLANTTLMRYVKELGTKKIKITPVTVKLNDDDDLQLALRTADMALEQAKSEEEFKKERRKEQRRERAKSQNTEN